MNTAAEWTQQYDAPTAVFIACALHDKGLVAGNRTSGGLLFGEQAGQVGDGVGIQAVVVETGEDCWDEGWNG